MKMSDTDRTFMEDLFEKKFRTFSKAGWNPNGSRMLAMASIVSRKTPKKLKKKFADIDIFLVFVLLSLAIKFLSMVPILVVSSLSISYSVKKLVTKLYLEDLLIVLSADVQKVLVLKLMDLCELKNIDPESVEDLLKHLEEDGFSGRVLDTVIDFIHNETKFYVQ